MLKSQNLTKNNVMSLKVVKRKIAKKLWMFST